MNLDGRWVDSCIHNVSSRGMLVASDDAPKPGAYVDIRRGSIVIIGRVVWRKDRFFGVRTQDRISATMLVSEPRLTHKPGATPSDRRSQARLSAEGRNARRAEHNRHRSSMIQFAGVAIAVICAAAFVAHEAYAVLARPMAVVEAALGGTR